MTNPVYDVDLFVIGGGSGGVRAARIASGHGARVALAEEFRLGGTCVIRGCVPKKIYVYAGRFADAFRDAPAFGWSLDAPPRFDWPRLVAAKEREITRLSGLYGDTLGKAGVTVHPVRATVFDAHAVELADGRRVTARHILVATGGTPELRPPVPGLEHAISSDQIFDLPVFPRRLLAIGAGYIALEFASALAHLGSAVTVAFRGEKVLRGFDDDLRDALTGELEAGGITLRPGLSLRGIEKTDEVLRATLSDGSVLEVDQVLVATGRRPHTRDLGLEAAGVALDEKGSVKVNAFSTSSVPSIHAVGDVTDRLNLTPIAIREGHLLADTLFGGRPATVDHGDVATAVFTTPELGTVGLTEAEARARFAVVDIYKTSFRPLSATVSGSNTRMVMKIVVDGTSDRVLGVHVLGEGAGEMAQLLGVAVKMKATKADFDDTVAVHPTAAEELVTLRTRTARHLREAVAA